MHIEPALKVSNAKYPVDFDATEYYQKLVRIIIWTEEVFQKEAALKRISEEEQIKIDYIIRQSVEMPVCQFQTVTVYNTETINPESISDLTGYDGFDYVIPILY